MKNTLIFLIGFASGTAVGVLATWHHFKSEYEKMAQEDFESRRNMVNRDDEPTSHDIRLNTSNTSASKPDLMEYASKIRENGYSPVDYNGGDKVNTQSSEDGEEVICDGPHVITPESFMEIDEYDHVSLTYYADGVLTDETDEVITNADEMIGVGTLDHFGEYEDDSVYVRDDRIKCDYEILRDERNYDDVSRPTPVTKVEE